MSTSANRVVRGAATVLAASAVLALPTAGASASPSVVGVGVARTDDAQRGAFRVPAWTDATSAQITSVTAAIRDGDQVVAMPALTDAGGGYWTTATPLELTEDGGPMPHLGSYAIDITATDDQGNSDTRVGAGTLDFTLRPQFAPVNGTDTVGFTRPVLDLQQHSTAVTGTLVGIQPGSGDLVPLANRTVTVVRSYDPGMPGRPADQAMTAVTDAQGTFRSGEFAQTWVAGYLAAFGADDSEVDGDAASGYAAPTVHATAVHIFVNAVARRVEPGRLLSISGTVREGASATSPVVAGAPIALSLSSFDTSPQAVVTTDAAGHFAGHIVAVSGDYTRWSAAPWSVFLTGERASGDVVVPSESAYSSVGIRLDRNGTVYAHGTLSRVYQPEQAVYQPQGTRLEYSRNGRTGWTVIAHTSARAGAVTLTAGGYVDGYYRLHHPTSDELTQTVTAPVHLHRIPMRIADNNAAPEPVAKGATVTVTGTLQEWRSGWHPLGGRPVFLYFAATGARSWTYLASGRTDAHGHAALHAKAIRAGKWLLQYFGDAVQFNSVATPDYVDVR